MGFYCRELKDGYTCGTIKTDLKSAMTYMDMYLTVAHKFKTSSFPDQIYFFSFKNALISTLLNYFKLNKYVGLHLYCVKNIRSTIPSISLLVKQYKICSLLEAEVIMCRSRLSREEIYIACKFLYAGTSIKKHASSRSVVVVVLYGLFFFFFFFLTDWLTDRTNELTRGIPRKCC